MKTLMLCAAVVWGTLPAVAQEIAFIAHPETRESTILADDAKNLLLGNLLKWRSGPVVKLVVQSEGALHEKVVRDYTQRTPDQFEKFWRRRVFTGQGAMPAQAKTDAEVLAYVAQNPGAFGYVERTHVTPAVKVLAIQ